MGHFASLRDSYRAAAGRWDWGWVCLCHNWCLPPAAGLACPLDWHCTQPGGQCWKLEASSLQWGSSDFQWLLGLLLQAVVHRVSTEQTSCWGEQQSGEGSRAAEAEYGSIVNFECVGVLTETGLEHKLTRWCCREEPLWLVKLCWCKEAGA